MRKEGRFRRGKALRGSRGWGHKEEQKEMGEKGKTASELEEAARYIYI
jgi:hypothetical protein